MIRTECKNCHQWHSGGWSSVVSPCNGSDYRGPGRKDPRHRWVDVEANPRRPAVESDALARERLSELEMAVRAANALYQEAKPGEDSGDAFVKLSYAMHAFESARGLAELLGIIYIGEREFYAAPSK